MSLVDPLKTGLAWLRSCLVLLEFWAYTYTKSLVQHADFIVSVCGKRVPERAFGIL